MVKPKSNAPKRAKRSALPQAVPGEGKIWLRDFAAGTPEYGNIGILLRKNLTHWIRERGFTTFEKFAYECGIPKSTLSQILNQTRDPRLGTLEQVARALGLEVSTLLVTPTPLPKDWDKL